MAEALDGDYIIPRLEILKLYIGQDLESKVLIQPREYKQVNKQEKKASFEEEIWEKFLNKMTDLTQKIQNPQPQEHLSQDTGEKSVEEVFNQLKNLSGSFESQNKIQLINNQDQKIMQTSQPFSPRNPAQPKSSGYKQYFPA
ncbi:hypothetical protein O181_068299 [Austropuccinia psidii MF-1]|uniref:Uncharacterized protein n=1 Tax=Austropuccinia psidii MF-1 TaxID=1389203 RepID=A0A9Q3EWM1_9BASI|nr:hypothetical protein [Austropuccinia psidii MF-1]